ncbi:hypothetical protein AAC03nite_38150 [Alicyclobacillus acidoterrestris]|nr:hypothetical protein AAC03nite_38150 [Alicyclobacillus acidoterrestris]
MIVYYNSTTGAINCIIAAGTPDLPVPNNPGTPLYLDDTQYADLWNNGSPLAHAYEIQNNVPVALPPIPLVQQVEAAATVQIAAIEAACSAVVNGQFTSKATGHTYASSVGGQVNFLAELPRFQYDSTLTTVSYDTLDAGWVDHTEQDIKNALVEGGRWKDAQYAQMNALIAQVQQLAATEGTTVEQIQAIVFTEADYQGVNEQSSDSGGSTDTSTTDQPASGTNSSEPTV